MTRTRILSGRCLAALLLVLGAVAGARAQQPAEPAAPPPPPPPPAQEQAPIDTYTMRTDVNLVLLHVSVVDANGQFVPGMTANDFRVFEDGVQQKLSVMRQEDAPVSMSLLIDSSDSMEEKRAQVNAAALTLVESSNPDDEVSVAHFSEGYELNADFTADLSVLRKALNGTESRGSTALYDALLNSLDHLKSGLRNKKVLLIVTDGEDNKSQFTLQAALEEAQRSNALIYAIGLLRQEAPASAARARQALVALTQATGGAAYFPEGVAEVQTICAQIARDIRHQYTLGYYPTNPAKDGTFRTLRVQVFPQEDVGALTVRTRTGYFAERITANK